ncbi:MAG: hypothetical protein HY080_12000 [Gammaproteobacteria bacterium]|nr:hypothetical protein [Gammaproteobacteria bacterium]
MKINKSKVVWLVIILVSNGLFFLGGLVTGRLSSKDFYTQVLEYAEANVALADYVSFRNIMLNIKVGKYESATCRSELSATSSFDIAKNCLANPVCKLAFEKKAREGAPELFGEAPKPFTPRDQCP